jgi:MSHA pilin protein MshD
MSTVKAGRGVGCAGATLVELIVFIVIVSLAVAGVLLAINMATRGGADPMIRKNALSIAEALLEEVSLMPFTYCDADDAQAATATAATLGATGCLATVDGIGPEAGESRYAAATPFDHIDDYNGFSMSPIVDITNSAIAGLANYSAAVAVTVPAGGLGGIAATDANGQANVLLITVTVNGPQNTSVVLQGYRTKYAPQI